MLGLHSAPNNSIRRCGIKAFRSAYIVSSPALDARTEIVRLCLVSVGTALCAVSFPSSPVLLNLRYTAKGIFNFVSPEPSQASCWKNTARTTAGCAAVGWNRATNSLSPPRLKEMEDPSETVRLGE